MLTSVRSLLAATILAGSAFAAAPAAAQSVIPSDFTISGSAGVVSEYRFRGVDLSGGDIAIQGGIDIAHSSGIYVGTWGSSIDEDTVGYGHTELNLFGGWSSEVTPGVAVDVGAIAYIFPNAGLGDYDYYEGYASAGFGFGPGLVSVGLAYAPKQDGLGGGDNLYVFTDASVGIPNTPVTLSGHVGYTDGFLTYTNDGDAWDFSIGADLALTQNLAVGVAYVGSEGDYAPGDYNFTDDAVVFKLSAGF